MEAVQAVGSIYNGVAGYQAGVYNRRASYEEARGIEMQGAAEEARVRQEARAAIGEQLAAQSGSGFEIGTGSALDAIAESQIQAMLDAKEIRRTAAMGGNAKRAAGDMAMREGENALVSGILQAGANTVEYKTDWAAAKSGTRPTWGQPRHENDRTGSPPAVKFGGRADPGLYGF